MYMVYIEIFNSIALCKLLDLSTPELVHYYSLLKCTRII